MAQKTTPELVIAEGTPTKLTKEEYYAKKNAREEEYYAKKNAREMELFSLKTQLIVQQLSQQKPSEPAPGIIVSIVDNDTRRYSLGETAVAYQRILIVSSRKSRIFGNPIINIIKQN